MLGRHNNFSKIFISVIYYLALTLPLSSCLTMITLMNKPQQKIEYKLAIKDNIIAAGKILDQPDEKSDNILLIGEKYSYLITEGGSTLEKLSISIIGPKLEIITDSPSTSNESNIHIDRDGKIFGTLKFTIRNIQNLTTEEDLEAKKLSFAKEKNNKSDYKITLEIRGIIAHKAKIPSTLNTPLSKKREIKIFSEAVDFPFAELKTALILPFAFAADVITAPIQLIWLNRK